MHMCRICACLAGQNEKRLGSWRPPVPGLLSTTGASTELHFAGIAVVKEMLRALTLLDVNVAYVIYNDAAFFDHTLTCPEYDAAFAVAVDPSGELAEAISAAEYSAIEGVFAAECADANAVTLPWTSVSGLLIRWNNTAITHGAVPGVLPTAEQRSNRVPVRSEDANEISAAVSLAGALTAFKTAASEATSEGFEGILDGVASAFNDAYDLVYAPNTGVCAAVTLVLQQVCAIILSRSCTIVAGRDFHL